MLKILSFEERHITKINLNIVDKKENKLESYLKVLNVS